MTDTLVVQTAWLGDVVLTTPLLRALAERYGPVDAVTTPSAASLIERAPAVRRVIPFDKRGRDRGATGLLRLARQLRARRYRRAFVAQESWRSALLVYAAGIPERVGFASAAPRWCYTARIRTAGPHEADRLLALARAPGAGSELSLSLTAADRAAGRRAIGAAGTAQPLVALAPGSARATKRWPWFRELAAQLVAAHDVLLVGAAAEAGPAWPPAATDLRGRCTLREAAAVLEAADVAVTNDSAPLHMAQAVRTPVVALFGPTAPGRGFGPRGAFDEVVQLDGLACRPCSSHGAVRCPLHHHRCLRDVPVAAVTDAVGRVLARAPRARSRAAPLTECV